MPETISAPEPGAPGKWITKVIMAVIVGEAAWGLLVSITTGLIVPGLAQVMGGDSQSPVYLGKGDLNLTSVFVSVLELCLAGIVAVILNQVSRSGPKVRVKTVKVKAGSKAAMPSVTPAPPVVQHPVSHPAAASVQPQAPAPAAPSGQPEKPAEVYYNLVGEPINPTEDDR